MAMSNVPKKGEQGFQKSKLGALAPVPAILNRPAQTAGAPVNEDLKNVYARFTERALTPPSSVPIKSSAEYVRVVAEQGAHIVYISHDKAPVLNGQILEVEQVKPKMSLVVSLKADGERFYGPLPTPSETSFSDGVVTQGKGDLYKTSERVFKSRADAERFVAANRDVFAAAALLTQSRLDEEKAQVQLAKAEVEKSNAQRMVEATKQWVAEGKKCSEGGCSEPAEFRQKLCTTHRNDLSVAQDTARHETDPQKLSAMVAAGEHRNDVLLAVAKNKFASNTTLKGLCLRVLADELGNDFIDVSASANHQLLKRKLQTLEGRKTKVLFEAEWGHDFAVKGTVVSNPEGGFCLKERSNSRTTRKLAVESGGDIVVGVKEVLDAKTGVHLWRRTERL